MQGSPVIAGREAFATRRPRILVLYHFFPPDDVVSAQVFGGLCEGLASRGWDVEARPSNRSCFDPGARHLSRETWRGIRLHRVFRPPLSQSSNGGRILNSVWMTAAWSFAAVRSRFNPDVVLVGTDPILSVFALRAWKLFRPNVKRVHWVFDVYPDAAIADGLLRENSLLARLLTHIATSGVQAAHLVADIGACMRKRLPTGPGAQRETFPPWALLEAPIPLEADPEERRLLFGAARLGILYSGSFGRAHSFLNLLALARRLRGTGIRFVFAVRGNREGELRNAITPADENVSFAPFVQEHELARRLGAADVHAMSLRTEWTGAVVPSKFQAALAAGRPVLFDCSPEAAPARWIEEYGLGWTLTPETLEPTALDLLAISESPSRLATLKKRCYETYVTTFSRGKAIQAWDDALRTLVFGPGESTRVTGDGTSHGSAAV